jgi:pimeloyl-ACP methyl ester carboxylesterase
MIKIYSSLVFLMTISFQTLVFAQDLYPAKIDTGRINGAMYRIVIPSNWNKNLIMYAHGYEIPSMNTDPKKFQSSGTDNSVKPFLDRGFAVARSAYRKTGWAFSEGVDDTEALRRYFVSKYGKPDTCFITGHSMGGGITLATIEIFPQFYQGAMPMCPLSNRPYLQVKMTFDILVVFSAEFPGVIPPLETILNGSAPQLSMPDVQAAISKDTAKAAAIARRFELKPGDLPMVIWFNDGIMRDIGKLAGGNPFDNTNTLYSGFFDDWALNSKVERLAAKPGTEGFFDEYDRTGNIDRPTLLVHTIYDQLIPASMAVIPIDNMVHKVGKQSNLVVVYTKGQGHCSFTPAETGKAVDLLRKWVSNGKRPRAGILECVSP